MIDPVLIYIFDLKFLLNFYFFPKVVAKVKSQIIVFQIDIKQFKIKNYTNLFKKQFDICAAGKNCSPIPLGAYIINKLSRQLDMKRVSLQFPSMLIYHVNCFEVSFI